MDYYKSRHYDKTKILEMLPFLKEFVSKNSDLKENEIKKLIKQYLVNKCVQSDVEHLNKNLFLNN